MDQFHKSDVKWTRTGENNFEGLEMEISPASKYYSVSCLLKLLMIIFIYEKYGIITSFRSVVVITFA